MTNLILSTDSYKLSHHNIYPAGTEKVYSYFESRKGAAYDETVFFGLQVIMDKLAGVAVTWDDVLEAQELSLAHFNRPLFNYEGWAHIVREHGGSLPLKIKAVPEGTPIPVGNVLMTVENTDPKCWWLTNAVESLLTHVWHPSTVATLSRSVKQVMKGYLDRTSDNPDALDFMLHDFGYRGATCDQAAAMGGMGHLINFKGTDTLVAMTAARDHYDASYDTLAFSVPATEHSVMTSLGQDGEETVVANLLDKYADGPLSCVADSYDYYNFVEHIVGGEFKERILDRNGVFIVRPDSVTTLHPKPQHLVAWTLRALWNRFGGHVNSKGFKVLDPHVRVIWGDGIDAVGIEKILDVAATSGFAADNLVFGMGGGLHQKVNRDTQRFAFKSSAQCRDGQWHDVFKKPLDVTKTSKAGRLSLIPFDGSVTTVAEADHKNDLLQTVFENGEVTKLYTFDEVRANAAIVTEDEPATL